LAVGGLFHGGRGSEGIGPKGGKKKGEMGIPQEHLNPKKEAVSEGGIKSPLKEGG